jgi:CTP:molybdopterin cytidylyltransferase MocA
VAEARIAGLVTAAGLGRRAGGPKAALVLEDDPRSLLERCVSGLLAAGCEQVFAVLRAEHRLLGQRAGAQVVCPDPAPDEMIDSVIAGLQQIELQGGFDGLLLCPVDAPKAAEFAGSWLGPALAAHSPNTIVPCFNGRPGHPAWLPVSNWYLLRGKDCAERGARAAFDDAELWTCTSDNVLDNYNGPTRA